MTLFYLIMALLFTTTMNEVWENRPITPRYWQINDSIEHEMTHKSDSLINNLNEWTVQDTLWMQN